MKKKKAGRFSILSCLVVTAVLAVLLAIGFTMPFAAEASINSDGWIPSDLLRQAIQPGDTLPSMTEKLGIKAGGWDCAGPCDGSGDYALKSAGPSDEDGPGGFAPRDRIGIKPDGPYLDDTLMGYGGFSKIVRLGDGIDHHH